MKFKSDFLRNIKIFRFLFYPIYLISFFIPKNKSIWLFGSGQDRFSENAKILFIYISEQQNSGIKPIWISGDRILCKQLQSKNYNAIYRWSLKGLYVSLRAKYYFYNIYSTDINFYTSGNAILVNLWHGIPLKQIEFDVDTGDLYKWYKTGWSYIYMFFKPYIFRRPDFVLSTSEKVSEIFSSAFRIGYARCLSLGYPRNDIFFNNSMIDTNQYTKKLILHTDEYHSKGNKVLIYMPTWRASNKDFFDDAIPNFEQLNHILKKHLLVMYIKPHPMTKHREEIYSNILFIKPYEDIYPLLPVSDYLITDYSSIYFDYLLLDKEIIFYPFDYDDYIAEDRQLYFDYDEITPGEKVYTFEKLLDTLSILNNLDFSKERQQIKNKFWDFKDGHSSKRIYEYFLKIATVK